MAATINGVTFADAANNTSGSTYLPDGQLSMTGKLYAIPRVDSPGADGTFPKNMGFRSAHVTGKIRFVAGDTSAAVAAAAAFGSTLAPADFAATVNGESLAACGNAIVTPVFNELLSIAGTTVGICDAIISFDQTRTS